jgi:hypothetical protein
MGVIAIRSNLKEFFQLFNLFEFMEVPFWFVELSKFPKERHMRT